MDVTTSPGSQGLMTRGAQLACAALASGLHAALYSFANRYPLTTPALWALTPLDQAVPFAPWTVWLYVSDYLLVVVAFLTCRRQQDALRFMAAFTLAVVTSVGVQWVLPVAYPRELYPLQRPLDASGMMAWLVRTVDSPASCFPSLHVALAYVCAQAARRPEDGGGHRLDWRWAALMLWATGVAASTLTFKQHYLVDVVGGAALAAAITAAVDRVLTPGRSAALVAWVVGEVRASRGAPFGRRGT